MNATAMRSFTLRIFILSGKQILYRAWSTTAGLEAWFLRQADFYSDKNEKRSSIDPAQKNDSYEWWWHGYPDDVSEKNKILSANGEDEFKFEFTQNSTVTITLKEEEEGTMVTLLQNNIPDEEDPAKHLYIQCQKGWTFYLANLKSILEGGIDLRNKDVNLTSVINA